MINEWIPVEEMLPSSSGYYLVQFDYLYKGSTPWCEVVSFQHKCKKWKRLNNCAVAWMPLPELYKSNRKEVG